MKYFELNRFITRTITITLAFAAFGLSISIAELRESLPDEAKIAVNRSIPLIQKSLTEYPLHAACFSCHHQGVGIFALSTAAKQGYKVDQKVIDAAIGHTCRDIETDIEEYKKGAGQPGGVTRAGYAMLALESGGFKGDTNTSIVSDYLIKKDSDKAFWHSSSNRPPSERSEFTDTFLAIRSLKAYAESPQRKQLDEKLKKSIDWLSNAEVKETEDRTFQLWALKEAKANKDTIKSVVKNLLSEQKPDGGWAQLPGMESDAYATGNVMSILLLTNAVSKNDPVIKHASEWLLKSQLPDGSWHVVSRSKPFQPYFESGFPHGKDQFISMAATCWATVGLSLATANGK